MSTDRLLSSSLDPLSSTGARNWAFTMVITIVLFSIGAFVPIYSTDHNHALELLMNAEAIRSESNSAVTATTREVPSRISFDRQMILEVFSSWKNVDPQWSENSWFVQLRKVAKHSTHLAKGEVVLGVMLLVCLFTYWRGYPQRTRNRLLGGFLGMVMAASATWVLKIALGRARPNNLIYHDQPDWNFLSLENLHHSFPSGHATAVGSVMMLLTLFFPRLWWIWALTSIWICSTRVLTGNHWPTDALCGVITGSFCVALVSGWLNGRIATGMPIQGIRHSSREISLPVE